MKLLLQRCVMVLALVALLVFPAAQVGAEDSTYEVHLVRIRGRIEQGLAAFVSRALREAEREGADAVVFDIDTPGGFVDAALKIRDSIVNSGIRTVAYVNPRAWSAGALIAMACEELSMKPGSSMGAAETRPNEEKYISAVRAEFEATADLRGRDPQVAGAMVDADIEIPGLVGKGKILTLTATQALKIGFADVGAINVEQLLGAIGLAGAEIVDVQATTAEGFARLLTNDVAAQILLTVGLVGLVVEMLTPGFGLPGTIGLVSLGLFFGGRLVGGMAGWEVVALFLVGFALLVVELFLIPGFGVAGILGVVSIFASLIMSYPTPSQAMNAIAIALVSTIVLVFIVVKFLTRGGAEFARSGRLVLRHSEEPHKGYVAVSDLTELVDKVGAVVTPLRPVGTVDIEGRHVEAISESGFLTGNARVRVVKVEGNRVFVRAFESEEQEG